MNAYPTDEPKVAYGNYGQTDAPDYAVKSSKLPLSEQEKLIAVLNETISELTDRLSPILEPDYPQESAQTENERNEREVSPLGEQMKANNRGVARAATRLRALIERLEC